MLNTVREGVGSAGRKRHIRHRGRGAQAVIYLGKLLRMFVYQNDWKVLPMAALIAALVSMVIRGDFFITMEGSLKGAFALTCVSIWNGCFNSIQVICRERNVIKREHRSGMHITSYIASHMIYQMLLCIVQSVLTVFVLLKMDVQIPMGGGVITGLTLVDLTITIFLISYASDMLSLFLSAIAHSTTAALTVMPFVLIFQLVFSGGVFSLPQWSRSLSEFTISSYGLKCIAAQSDYNTSPMVTAWETLAKLKDYEIGGSFTVGQALDFLTDENNAAVREIRQYEIDGEVTVGQIGDFLNRSQTFRAFLDTPVGASFTLNELMSSLQTGEELAALRDKSLGIATVGEIIDVTAEAISDSGYGDQHIGSEFSVGELLGFLNADRIVTALKDQTVGGRITVGEVIDLIAANPDVQARRGQTVTLKTTFGRLVDLVGEETVRDYLQTRTGQVSYVKDYENTAENIRGYWVTFILFALFFSLLATVFLEFIDKDKR